MCVRLVLVVPNDACKIVLYVGKAYSSKPTQQSFIIVLYDMTTFRKIGMVLVSDLNGLVSIG